MAFDLCIVAIVLLILMQIIDGFSLWSTVSSMLINLSWSIYPNNTRDVYLYIYWVSAYMG